MGVGTTGFKDVDSWRELLGATEDTYSEFKELNKKIIKPATKGVSQKSGIIVEPEFERERRKIARIKFNVSENPQMQLLDYKEHNRIRHTDAYKRARDLGLKDVEIIHWIETKGDTFVAEVVAYVEGKKGIKNTAGYLVQALKGAYGVKSAEERQREQAAREQAETRRLERAAQAEAEAAQEALKTRFHEHRRQRTREIIATLSDKDVVQISAVLSDNLPPIRSVSQAWHKIEANPRRVEELSKVAQAVIGGALADHVLERWGRPEDQELVAFQAQDMTAP